MTRKYYIVYNDNESHELVREEVQEFLGISYPTFRNIVGRGSAYKGWKVKAIPYLYVAMENGEVVYSGTSWEELANAIGYEESYVRKSCITNRKLGGRYFICSYQATEDKKHNVGLTSYTLNTHQLSRVDYALDVVREIKGLCGVGKVVDMDGNEITKEQFEMCVRTLNSMLKGKMEVKWENEI